MCLCVKPVFKNYFGIIIIIMLIVLTSYHLIKYYIFFSYPGSAQRKANGIDLDL